MKVSEKPHDKLSKRESAASYTPKKITVAVFFELGPYTDPSAAHERALKEQNKGAKNVRIDKEKGMWWISGVQYK